jgi:hypothetical protein
MNSFEIKIIAIITMIIDHIGLFFFPHIFILRVIGRLSFPLFAWLIANGAVHTKNIIAYAIRLFLFALISQMPFLYANRQITPAFGGLNVIFTLFLGLVVIIVMKKTSRKNFWLLATIIASAIADVSHMDYGAVGVLSIISFYLFYNKFDKMIVSQTLLLFILPYLMFFLEIFYRLHLSFYYMDSDYEFFGIFSLFFIAIYNKKQGHKLKYLFYCFYPLQYVAIIFFKSFTH